MVIGYRLSKLRTECKRVPVDSVVIATGISRESILSYENDGVEPPKEHLVLLAAFYDVTVERLLGIDVDLNKYHFHFSSGSPSAEDLEDMRDTLRDFHQTKHRFLSLSRRWE